MSPFKLFALAVMAGVLWLPSHPAAADDLDKSVGKLAEKMARYLQSKNENSISIGEFVGPDQFSASGGPGISESFRSHFERLKINVSSAARINVHGQYSLSTTPGDGVGIKIDGSLVDPQGKVISDFSFDVAPGQFTTVVDKPDDVVQVLGVTTSLHPEDRDDDRARDIRNNLQNPKLFIDGSKFGAEQRSPYRVEILVRQQPLVPQLQKGLGFVGINRGDAYAIKLYNDSELEAAVKVSIDGLSVFQFSDIRGPDGSPKYKVYIIAPHSFIVLQGWHKTNQQVSSFVVTRYAESAAGSIQHTQDIGTISALFFAAWPKGGQPPRDESFFDKGVGDATGFGPPMAQQSREVERDVGRLRAAVSIRYAK